MGTILKYRKRQRTPLASKHMATLAWHVDVDRLAKLLCPQHELESFLKQSRQFSGNRQVTAFPVWKRHRKRAEKAATMIQIVPFLKRLPVHIAWLLGEVLLR